jgi:uncharacterized protein (DUF1697 family)
MATFIALVRGINVGGHKKIAMADLRDLLLRMGFKDTKSLLNSGNLVFRSKTLATGRLELLLEAETKKQLSFETHFFVRTTQEWQSVIAHNPFPREAERDPGHLVVMLLKKAPEPGDLKTLQRAITGNEVIRGEGREAYIIYPDGIGRSRLTNALIESKLGSTGTARNWNTVLKLAAISLKNEDSRGKKGGRTRNGFSKS